MLLLENLPPEAWNAEPPSGRSIPAIVAHMHNARVMWLKAAKLEPLPQQLERHAVTVEQALAALTESRDGIARVIRTAMATTGRVRNAPPDVAHASDAPGIVALLERHGARGAANL